jgi:ferritin-like metal-binding protein YciE
VERLERVFQLLNKPPRGEKCEAVKGLIEEGEEVMKKTGGGPVCDAGMIGVGQAIEHYEILRYGTLIAWARQLGLSEATSLLEETLRQEKHADETLSKIALHEVNRKAA